MVKANNCIHVLLLGWGSITCGSVCAKSAHAAQRLVSNAHSGQGTGSDEVVVIYYI